MKITKTQKTVDAENTARIIANAGCDTCPNCGEHTEMFFYVAKGIPNKGLISRGTDCRLKGFFSKSYRVDMYKCATCGVEWESEPY